MSLVDLGPEKSHVSADDLKYKMYSDALEMEKYHNMRWTGGDPNFEESPTKRVSQRRVPSIQEREHWKIRSWLCQSEQAFQKTMMHVTGPSIASPNPFLIFRYPQDFLKESGGSVLLNPEEEDLDKERWRLSVTVPTMLYSRMMIHRDTSPHFAPDLLIQAIVCSVAQEFNSRNSEFSKFDAIRWVGEGLWRLREDTAYITREPGSVDEDQRVSTNSLKSTAPKTPVRGRVRG